MTNDELRAFKTLFSKYCHAEMGKGHCNGEECEWCPINKAYEEVERFEKLDSNVNVHQRRAAAAREFGKVETAIKRAAREANVDMRDVKHIFKRIK